MTEAIAIKIKRKPNDHTHYIGQLDNGNQFMALEAFFHKLPITSDWQRTRKEFVVFHLFDKDGKHLSSKHQFVGITADIDGRELNTDIENLMVGMGHGVFTDIRIQPFSVSIDEFEYGFIKDDENYCFILEPNDLSFYAPFDGEYES